MKWFECTYWVVKALLQKNDTSVLDKLNYNLFKRKLNKQHACRHASEKVITHLLTCVALWMRCVIVNGGGCVIWLWRCVRVKVRNVCGVIYYCEGLWKSMDECARVRESAFEWFHNVFRIRVVSDFILAASPCRHMKGVVSNLLLFFKQSANFLTLSFLLFMVKLGSKWRVLCFLRTVLTIYRLRTKSKLLKR